MPEQPNILNAFLQRLGQGVSQIPPGTNPLLDVGRGLGAPQSTPGVTIPSLPPQAPPIPQGIPAPTQSLQGGTVTGTEQGKTPKAKPSPEQDKKRAEFIQQMVKLGIPLGAAILGSVNPDLLPQAAGLAGGFTGEIQRQDVAQEEEAEENRRLATVLKNKKEEITTKANLDNEQFSKLLEALSGGEITDPGKAAKTARKEIEANLPASATEENIRFTMEQEGLSREEVIRRIRK